MEFHCSDVMLNYMVCTRWTRFFLKECFGDLFVLSKATKVHICEPGEADDGVRGAQGSRWRCSVERRVFQSHPQPALHF